VDEVEHRFGDHDAVVQVEVADGSGRLGERLGEQFEVDAHWRELEGPQPERGFDRDGEFVVAVPEPGPQRVHDPCRHLVGRVPVGSERDEDRVAGVLEAVVGQLVVEARRDRGRVVVRGRDAQVVSPLVVRHREATLRHALSSGQLPR
jgi:hypothetical protein